MKVIRGWSTDPTRSLVDPLLEKNWSFFLEFRGGDICDPVSIGGMGWYLVWSEVSEVFHPGFHQVAAPAVLRVAVQE